MSAASAAMFEERAEPGEWLSLALAVLVHVVLALVLVFGVNWQSRPPESVTVELWEAPQAAPPPPVHCSFTSANSSASTTAIFAA